MRLAELSRAGELTAIWVPEPRDEAVRDVCRAREDAVGTRLNARQQLLAFLLRHAVRYTGKTRWSLAHRRWLASVHFDDPNLQVTFTEYWQAVVSAEERVERLTAAVAQATRGWRLESQVAALQALRGIDQISAAGLVAEIGDLARFGHPRELMGYLGLVPSEHSSGPSVQRGAITKTGNTHARRLLVEAAWSYRFTPRIGVRAARRQEALSEWPRTLAWKAQLRLCRRFQRLTARGLHRNKVCVAVARELAGFVWAMARATPLAT